MWKRGAENCLNKLKRPTDVGVNKYPNSIVSSWPLPDFKSVAKKVFNVNLKYYFMRCLCILLSL